MSTPYKKPVTSTVFECIGAAAFIAGIFAFIAAFADTSNGQSGAPGSIAGSVCVIMAAVYIGIGQVIHFLGRASHRSDQVAALLMEEILPQLKAIDARLASQPAGLPSAAPAIAPSSPTATPQAPSPDYFYSKDGKEEGPFNATELQALRAKGAIKDTTPVFRTGDKDWLPYRQYPDLAKK